jgi:hypothetical protein
MMAQFALEVSIVECASDPGLPSSRPARVWSAAGDAGGELQRAPVTRLSGLATAKSDNCLQ